MLHKRLHGAACVLAGETILHVLMYKVLCSNQALGQWNINTAKPFLCQKRVPQVLSFAHHSDCTRGKTGGHVTPCFSLCNWHASLHENSQDNMASGSPLSFSLLPSPTTPLWWLCLPSGSPSASLSLVDFRAWLRHLAGRSGLALSYNRLLQTKLYKDEVYRTVFYGCIPIQVPLGSCKGSFLLLFFLSYRSGWKFIPLFILIFHLSPKWGTGDLLQGCLPWKTQHQL